MRRILLAIILTGLAFAAIPDNYYDGTEGLSGEALKSKLHTIIDSHKEFSYNDLWSTLKETDEDPANSGNFILMYSGWSVSKSSAYPIWNREHSWPKSHGNFGTSAPAGTDMHHLRPTDCDVNSNRGNKDYDNGGSRVSVSAGQTDCYTDSDSFEPRDAVKGDCARMMFYMATRYEGDASGEPDLELVDYTGTSGSKLGKLSTLLEWNAQDPVDDFERDRNDAIYGYQENRNPFVDHPEYVAYIWGGEIPQGIVAPAAYSASSIDSTSFTANWSSVDVASGYKLYVSESSVFSTFLNGYSPKSVTATSESISGLNPDTDYYYRLKAYTADEESGFSNIVSVTTLIVEDTSSVTPPDTNTQYRETFANFPATGSSYVSGSFTGEAGITWAYENCRGDISLDEESACLAKGKTPEASLVSSLIPGGISTLNFQYKQAFSTDVLLDVYVNDELVTTVSSSNESGTVKSSGQITVNVDGNLTLKFIQNNSGSGQVAIDNVAWNNYEVNTLDPVISEFRLGQAYPNPFNPVCALSLDLDQDQELTVNMYDLTGRTVQSIYSGYMSAGHHTIKVQAGDLPAGIYLVGVSSSTERLMRKIVLVK